MLTRTEFSQDELSSYCHQSDDEPITSYSLLTSNILVDNTKHFFEKFDKFENRIDVVINMHVQTNIRVSKCF